VLDPHQLYRSLDQPSEVGRRHGRRAAAAKPGADQAEWVYSEHFPSKAGKPELAEHLGARQRGICSDDRSIESAHANTDQPRRRLDPGLEESEKRADLRGPSCAATAQDPDSLGPAPAYVPSSQELKYLTCSSVKVSMATPIASSFNLATAASISLGTS
jgi:hypothetical protein